MAEMNSNSGGENSVDMQSPKVQSNSSIILPSPMQSYLPVMPQIPLTSIPDLSSRDLDGKIDVLISLAQSHNRNMFAMHTQLNTITSVVNTLATVKHQQEALKDQLLSAQGHITRLEDNEKKQNQEILELKRRGNKDALVFYNIPENGSQAPEQLQHVLYKVFTDKMGIHLNSVFSPNNPGGEIRIKDIHRIGKSVNGKPRAILVHFLTSLGRYTVYTKKYLDTLRLNTDIRVSEFYDSETREKITALFDDFKVIRDQHSSSGKKVSLVNSTILVEKQPIILNKFERNPLPSSTTSSLTYKQMCHSRVISKDHSYFQAHSAPIASREHATAARNAILANPERAKSDHVMYAYKYSNEFGTHTGFSDDSEIAGSRIIDSYLQNEEIDNIFICVTRLKKGQNIGRIRFELIEEVTKEIIKLSKFSDPPSQYYKTLQ